MSEQQGIVLGVDFEGMPDNATNGADTSTVFAGILCVPTGVDAWFDILAGPYDGLLRRLVDS